MNEIEKAINILNNIISDTKDVAGTEEYCEAVRLGREALEKQIPKKPTNTLRHRGGFEIEHCPNCERDYQVDRRYKMTDAYCGECGKLLDSAFRNCCGNCGQSIDWSVEE